MKKPVYRKIVPVDKRKAYNVAVSLLRKGESEIPKGVCENIDFLCSKKVGFILSRNPAVGSCRDARTHRYRLGHVGIPLCDELKSIVGTIENDESAKRFIVVHCRSNLDIDYKQVLATLNSHGKLRILKEKKLFEVFGANYGTVNPPRLELRASETNLIHIFDESVFRVEVKLPGTMMTNAGHHTWAVEFDPVELFKSMDNAIRSNISIPNQIINGNEVLSKLNPKSVGIITGNGPDSGMALWRQINDSIAGIKGSRFQGDLSLPIIHVASLPALGLSMELDRRWEATWATLEETVRSFCKKGVKIICLACHTTHYFAPDIKKICKEYGVTFISMADAVIDYIRVRNINEVAILGIPHVADLGEWSPYSALNKYNIEQLSTKTLADFQELGYIVKQKASKDKGFQRLVHLLKTQVKSEHIIIALTELSILLQGQRKKNRKNQRHIVDALVLYGEAVARASLGMPWQGSRLTYEPERKKPSN